MLRKIPLPLGKSHVEDIARLTRTELSRKYAMTYTSWRNGKQRAGKYGNWDPAFDDFADFLRCMGPRTNKDMSLDRIDNSNPRYGPGLCRWADRQQQAANRATTRQIESEGVIEALPDVARRQGEQPGALRNRLSRAGKFKFPSDPRLMRPWPLREDKNVQEMWESKYLASGGFNRWSRYEFLIFYLRKRIEEKEEFIENNYHDDSDEISSEVSGCRDFIKKASLEIERALVEKPLWEMAVREYELRQPERRFLRSGRSGYLCLEDHDRDWY